MQDSEVDALVSFGNRGIQAQAQAANDKQRSQGECRHEKVSPEFGPVKQDECCRFSGERPRPGEVLPVHRDNTLTRCNGRAELRLLLSKWLQVVC